MFQFSLMLYKRSFFSYGLKAKKLLLRQISSEPQSRATQRFVFYIFFCTVSKCQCFLFLPGNGALSHMPWLQCLCFRLLGPDEPGPGKWLPVSTSINQKAHVYSLSSGLFFSGPF